MLPVQDEVTADARPGLEHVAPPFAGISRHQVRPATKREDRRSTNNLCVIHGDPPAGSVQRGKRRSSWVSGSGPLVVIQRAVVASGCQETWGDELRRQQIRVRSSLLSIEIVANPCTPTWTRLTE